MNSLFSFVFLIAVAHARFGQEQIPIPAISAVQGGAPGVAQTVAGAAISDLLAGANACAKLQRADQILAELGTGADAVKAAIGMVSAEKNVNPFAQQQPNICSDPTLPQNQMLRGITPLVDPAFTNAGVANALSAATVAKPLDATGKSVADLMAENGFAQFLAQAVGGTPQALGGAAAGGAGAAENAASTAASSAVAAADTVSSAAAAITTAAAATGALDFGSCPNPTIVFGPGFDGRKENSFEPADITAFTHGSALNIKVITDFICQQLQTKCGANSDALTACAKGAADAQTAGGKNQAAADAFNAALGFGAGAAATTAVDTAVAAVTSAAVVTDGCAAQVAQALASASSAAAAAAAGTAVDGNVSATQTAAVPEDTVAAAAGDGTADGTGANAGSSVAGADFGKCDPTIKFEGGLGGRPATEFTFQSQDPKIEAIQQEALNPNIITNRICDELTNQCAANAAAKTLCESAQAQIQALGTRDVTTAQTWNQLLGFAGIVTNPDGGPATPEDAGAGAKLRRSSSFRA